jgi:hypothetical protein
MWLVQKFILGHHLPTELTNTGSCCILSALWLFRYRNLANKGMQWARENG